ncbi:hypothetical protein LJR219_002639 [Phenylobacterium sp. LjRoot219]|uniref:hypothetical protein n=1 Tax=Phenylobacterium sp. LjRoot219 TaxID=3342283 RepID=UPI003ECC6B53
MNGAVESLAPPPPRNSILDRIVGQWRHNPKLELWLAWGAIVVFYNIFGIVFFVMSRTQPPPQPWWELVRIGQWFNDNHLGVLAGFGIIFLIAGFTTPANALIAYSMRRMSVSPAFAYSYLAIYSLAAVPGMLLTCIVLSVGAMRPDRDLSQISLLYDFGFMAFGGTMGIFLIGSVVWAVAILIDKNRVLPKWFAYLNICNAMTEVVIAPTWIFKSGPFAWNGVIAFYINMVVFVIYTSAFITLLRKMIVEEDLSAGPIRD